MPQSHSYLIALGANLPSTAGRPEETLQAAVEKLSSLGFEDLQISRFFRTPCFPKGAGPDYVNAAAHLRFGGTPKDLLDILHSVEAAFGRQRTQRWGQRTLDLDLIAAGGQVLPDRPTFQAWHDLSPDLQHRKTPEQLILPHPRMQDRAFVLVPLADVAPEWRHPVLGHTVLEMLRSLDNSMVEEVRPI